MNYQFSYRVDRTVNPFRYIVSLSDGTTIYENHIPGLPSTWMRLREFLSQSDIRITRIRLQYGDKTVSIEQSDAYGIIYKETGGINIPIFYPKLIGVCCLTGGEVKVNWYNMQTDFVEQEVRSLKECKNFLIY